MAYFISSIKSSHKFIEFKPLNFQVALTVGAVLHELGFGLHRFVFLAGILKDLVLFTIAVVPST